MGLKWCSSSQTFFVWVFLHFSSFIMMNDDEEAVVGVDGVLGVFGDDDMLRRYCWWPGCGGFFYPGPSLGRPFGFCQVSTCYDCFANSRARYEARLEAVEAVEAVDDVDDDAGEASSAVGPAAAMPKWSPRPPDGPPPGFAPRGLAVAPPAVVPPTTPPAGPSSSMGLSEDN